MGKRVEPVLLDKRVKAALNETGLPWTIEPGSKHFHIRLAGRFCGMVPQGVKGETPRHLICRNVKQIKRIAAEIKGLTK